MRSEAIVEFGKPLQEIEKEVPQPGGSEVLVRVRHSGVCHSDVHIQDGYFDLGSGNKLPLKLPLPHVLGHEIEGEAERIGPDARNVKVGARYAVFPWIGCGDCVACNRGDENFCGKPRQLGCSPGVPGGYSTHVLVPHPKYLLDYGSVSPTLAAAYMCSGLTAFGAVKKVGKLGPDDQIVILGCGGVGMMGIEFARALTGKDPKAADIDEGRLEAAIKAGAKAAYNTKDAGAAKKLTVDTKGGAFAVIDFVGSEASFTFANSVVRRGGKIIVVGLFGGGMTMPLPMLPLRGLTIMGSYVGSLDEAQEMMTLVREGKIDPIPVETRPLSAASESLDDLRQGRVTGRVVLTP